MSNPIFYAADMSSASFSMSLSENASYPLSNFYTNVPSLTWKSSANSNSQTLTIDLGSAKEINFLALGSYNFNSMTSCVLVYGAVDDGAFASGTVAATINGGPSAPAVFIFSHATKRYWRIIFTNTNGLIPECGLLFLGLKMAMPFNYNMDAEIGNKRYQTTSRESLSGILRTSRQTDGRKRQEVSFTLIDDDTVTAWHTLMDAIKGRLNPFFFVDGDGNLDVWHSEDDYVPSKGVRANVNDIARMKMCKQTTG